MEITLFWNIIFTSALSLGFFLAIVLFVQYFKNKDASQLYLGMFVFIFSSILLNNFVYWHQVMHEYPHFIYSTISTPFLLMPLFYFYCKTFLQQSFRRKDIGHLMPFIILTLLFSPILLSSGAEKLALVVSFVEGNYPKWAYYTRHLKWVLSAQLLIYPFLVYYKLSHYLKTKKQNTSQDKLKQINWLYFFNSLILLYGLLMFLYYVLVSLDIGGIEKDYYISFVLCIAVYCIGYIGMDNPDLLKGEKFLQRIPPLKYTNTPLKKDYLENTMVCLEQLMTTEKVYLDADINLQKIAQKTAIPRHHISQALNQHHGKTFNEFINYYRIEHACQLLQESPDNIQIKTIMYNSGFNNRASFNNNFKKFKGMTASQYLNQQLQNSSK